MLTHLEDVAVLSEAGLLMVFPDHELDLLCNVLVFPVLLTLYLVSDLPAR